MTITLTAVQWVEELALAWDKGWHAGVGDVSRRSRRTAAGRNPSPNPYKSEEES